MSVYIISSCAVMDFVKHREIKKPPGTSAGEKVRAVEFSKNVENEETVHHTV